MRNVFVCFLMIFLSQPAVAQDLELPIEARYQFPVSLLCGPSSEAFQEGVVTGAYETVIHVQNPSFDADVRIAKSVTTSLPYQKGLPLGDVVESTIGAGGAIAISCDELRHMQASPMTEAFRSGYLVLWSDAPIDVTAGWSGRPRDGEITALAQMKVTGTELCPFAMTDPGTHAYADRICLGFSWTCDNPESLAVAFDGEPQGLISLARTEDHLLGDGSSTFCASTTGLEDGAHTIRATLACDISECALERPFNVANTPFRLLSARPDRKRYRGSDTVRITVILSETVDSLEADFTLLDTGFEADRLTIEETATPGTYLIEYRINGISNTNTPGIHRVPLSITDQGVTRRFDGLRIGYVGETRNLLAAVDAVPTTTIVGRPPNEPASALVEITDIDVSNRTILPLATVTVTGTVAGPLIDGQPRAEVEMAVRNLVLAWRERDLASAGAYRIRPAMLTLDCADGGAQLCDSGSFTVELTFPRDMNDIAKDGPHSRTLEFTLIDPDGGVADVVQTEVSMVVLSEEMYAGTPQSNGGASTGGTVGGGVDFRLGGAPPGTVDGSPLTLVLTWDGETGPGADLIPGENGDPQTLSALDLNIGLHRAPSDGHGGWFGNLGNAELVRKSNTCFSGLGLGQFSDDRWNCVCSDRSNLNMEVITYPPGVDLDVGGDGAGTFGAEYYIYDSCGSQQDTVATLSAYYCSSVEQHSFDIDAALSEEDEDLSQNWNNACLFGSPCHDPKTVPTGFNETGGFTQGFDFNPSDCSDLPIVAGHVSYLAPVNLAANDPSAAPPELFDPDPALDQSWAFFAPDLSEAGWTTFDVPFAKIEVSLVDGTEAVVGEGFTDEDGNFSLILPTDFAAGGVSGLVRVDVVTLSPEPHRYRVIQREEDFDDTGTQDLYRAVLADDFDPVANAGAAFDVSLNSGPDDEGQKEIAAAFHIFRNGIMAAQHMLTLNRLVPPYTVLYDRDAALVNNACDSQGSFYTGDYTHIQSIGPNVDRLICPAGQTAMDGTCNVACVADPGGAVYDEARADFDYDTHLHEYAHHVFTQLTSIGPRRFDDRGNASHFGNSSQKTSLTEGIAEAFGQALASKVIYDLYGEGVAMNTSQISCQDDDVLDCNLGLVESVDWLTTRGSEDLPRPGPDWQPQKDCLPGDPGCGCNLGACNAAGNTCQGGYCADTTGICTPGSLGCGAGAGCTTENAEEIGGICVLPVTYSDGWTWRVLWDLLDEGEDVQPEVSHWRNSQMSDATPAVPNPYDQFGDPDTFWRTVLAVTELTAADPVDVTATTPNMADILTQYRCRLSDEDQVAFDAYLTEVVEFPYHDPAACP